jgi:hypothetical protein
LIDQMIVVRLKGGIPSGADPHHWGSRTDYLVCHPSQRQGGIPCWPYVPVKVNGIKRSHGLAAAFAAVEHLRPERLHVIGYDRLLGRFETGKFNGYAIPEAAPHDWKAEYGALMNLGIPIIDLSENH